MKEENSFFERVYEVVRLVPKGRVTTYGAIAKYIGAAKAARMVGWAMNSSHFAHPIVPAHRVINRKGLLSGKAHFATENLMQQLLEKEGVIVIDDAVQNFDKLFWDPNSELL